MSGRSLSDQRVSLEIQGGLCEVRGGLCGVMEVSDLRVISVRSEEVCVSGDVSDRSGEVSVW